MIQLQLKSGAHRRIRDGHLWVFRDELVQMPEATPGTMVQVHTDYGYDLGLGLYNPQSQIVVRMLKTHTWNRQLLVDRLRHSLALRERLFAPEQAYRLVFGESDMLPGLIVDRYADYLSIQLLSAGMDLLRAEIVEALLEVLPNTRGIIARNDSQLRAKEGLERENVVLWGEIPDEIDMVENGLHYSISLSEGQKTGTFLDQRVNRRTVASLAKGLRVLDCFCNQGGFALNAAAGGAADALGIDSSQLAVQSSARNAALNGLSQARFECHDVFDFLKAQAAANQKWDMVILDPPAFTKSKAQVKSALRGYAEINRQALKIISHGGFLVSASCSHHVSEEMLMKVVAEEGRRINRRLCLIHRGMQSPCHPIYLPMPETSYLKFFVFEVQDGREADNESSEVPSDKNS